MSFNKYTFKDVNVIYGTLILEGFAEGDDVVNVEPTAEQFTTVAGAKGDVVRTQTNDNRAIATVNLLQTSKSKAALLALYNVDKLTGAGVLPLTIQNKETGELIFSANSWIQKAPVFTRGQNPNSVPIIFELADMLYVEG